MFFKGLFYFKQVKRCLVSFIVYVYNVTIIFKLQLMKFFVDMVLHKITWPLLMMRGWGIEILGYDPSEVIVELPHVVS